MKIVRSKEAKIGTVSMREISYGGCCRLVNTQQLGPSACILKTYMRVETSQREIQIAKRDGVWPRAQVSKLMDLASGEILCVPMNLQVIPVVAEVVVYD